MTELAEPETTPEEAASIRKRALLPSLMTRPLTLLFTVVIPQLILLVINLRAWHLMSGEVDELQRRNAILFFVGELLILLLGLGVAFWHIRKGKRDISWPWYWIIFVPTVAYLGCFLVYAGNVVPRALQAWIVIPETLIFFQFVFLMPALFLSTLALTCFPVKKGLGADVGISIGVAIGVPAFWYVLIHLTSGMGIHRLPGVVIFLMVTVMSLVCLGGVLRLLTMLFVGALQKGKWAQGILVGLVALVAPLGGLLLNRAIPFPSNFQIWPIYALVILNGVLLILPRSGREGWDRAVWLLQCGLFPFTLYFFLIFLPYLPLAAIAMIAAGAGFLILAPTALFIIHLKTLVQNCPSTKWILFGVLAALVLPGYLYFEMKVDRTVLHRAIDYVYSPTPNSEGEFRGDRDWLRRSLVRMKSVKEGVYLPFLTEWYEDTVLDGMVLSDDKLNRLYYTFFGESMPEVDSSSSLFGSSRASRNVFAGRATSPPPANVLLKDLDHERSAELGDGVRTLVKLTLENPSTVQSEYVTKIDLPEGTVVSGYWLHIGDERVPGQIFEKKTAMWVYRMIRDSRRDPGLLTYLSPQQLSLRVFPFAGKEVRITEIEFLSPPGVYPELKIGEEIVSSPEGQRGGKPQVWSSSENEKSVFLPEGWLSEGAGFEREPYFHFIVDRSHSGVDAAEAFAAMQAMRKRFPEVERFRISVANYEFVESDTPPKSFGDLTEETLTDVFEEIPLRGAFLSGIAMQRTLARRNLELTTDASESLLQYPVFVLVKGGRTVETPLPDLIWMEEDHPESGRYFSISSGSDLVLAKDFSGGKEPVEMASHEIALVACGEEVRAVPATRGAQLVRFSGNEAIEFLERDRSEFVDLPGQEIHEGENAYARAMEVHRLEDELRWNPDRSPMLLPKLVEASRQTRVLTPSTAYIVVENSAQWKMLKKKEKEKLKGNQALDFMEAPEPQVIWVVMAFLGFLYLQARRRRSRKLRTAG